MEIELHEAVISRYFGALGKQPVVFALMLLYVYNAVWTLGTAFGVLRSECEVSFLNDSSRHGQSYSPERVSAEWRNSRALSVLHSANL